jgi:UPF0755 protein
MMRVLATITLLLTLTAMALTVFVHHQLTQPLGEDALFDIPAGDNLSSITRRLDEQGLLPPNEMLFKVFALVTRSDGAIQAGQYQVEAKMNALSLLALFRSGRVVQHRITFPEGWTFQQWRSHIKQAPYLVLSSAFMTEEEVAVQLGVRGSLEGWLFPDTYQYIRGDTDLEILQLAVNRMREVLASEWQTRSSVDNLATPYEALILASIVEKETGRPADREPVASVFHNRLAQNMKLQTDPTVIYGLGSAFDGDLTRKHLTMDTPYNTYTRKGLPPTPICSPGIASIRAALGGSTHPYLHNKAVNEYQRKR